MNIVVSDTSPLLALHQVKLFWLVGRLFDEVLVPPAVIEELKHPPRVLQALGEPEISRLSMREPLDHAYVARIHEVLDSGESEAIALAIEHHVEAVLMDEEKGRRVARQLGLHPVGLLAILSLAKQQLLIPAIRPIIDELRLDHGFFLSDRIVNQVLLDAGETEGP